MIPPVVLGLGRKVIGAVAPYLTIALAIGASLMVIKLGLANMSLERKLSAAQKANADLTVELANEKADKQRIVAEYDALALADANRRADEERRANEEQRRIADAYRSKLAASDAALRTALDGLRHSADADRRRALKASDAAPAGCGAFAADPSNLSLPNAEFLVREAARADRLALQHAGLVDYVRTVCRPQGVSP